MKLRHCSILKIDTNWFNGVSLITFVGFLRHQSLNFWSNNPSEFPKFDILLDTYTGEYLFKGGAEIKIGILKVEVHVHNINLDWCQEISSSLPPPIQKSKYEQNGWLQCIAYAICDMRYETM